MIASIFFICLSQIQDPDAKSHPRRKKVHGVCQVETGRFIIELQRLTTPPPQTAQIRSELTAYFIITLPEICAVKVRLLRNVTAWRKPFNATNLD